MHSCRGPFHLHLRKNQIMVLILILRQLSMAEFCRSKLEKFHWSHQSFGATMFFRLKSLFQYWDTPYQSTISFKIRFVIPREKKISSINSGKFHFILIQINILK